MNGNSIIEWKISKINISYCDNLYFSKGVLVAVCENKSHYLPFGATDTNEALCHCKAISEMVERATWFSCYLASPNDYPNTIGFAAHSEISKCIIESKLEAIERYLFRLLSNPIKIKKLLKMNFFNLITINDSVIYLYLEINLFKQKYYMVYKISILDINCEQGIIIGMGKSKDIDKAIEHSSFESNLIKKALEKNHTKTDLNKMIFHDIQELRTIFKSKRIFQYIINHDYKKSSILDVSNIFVETTNVTQCIPTVFLPLNRCVYFSKCIGGCFDKV